MGLIAWIIIGLIAGFIARAIVPGRDPMGVVGTILLGMIGSLIGGFLGNLVAGAEMELETAGIIGSIIGAIIVLLILRMSRRRA